MRRSGWLLAPLAAAGLAGCPEDVTTPFSPDVGYAMLEPCEAALPEMPPEEGGVSTLGDFVADKRPGHAYAHGRAWVLAPVEDVWLALQDPCVSRIHTNDGFEPLPGLEDYPLTFRVQVHEDTIIGDVSWTHTYRGGPVVGGPGGREGYGMRYQKTDGIENVRTQSGSLEIFPAADPLRAATVTEVAYVHWLDADRSGVPQATGAVIDWFMDLLGELGQIDLGSCPGTPEKCAEWTRCPGNGAGID